jgi:hypothetical protein
MTDPNRIEQLLRLKTEDPEKFAIAAYSIITTLSKEALSDPTPKEEKVRAIDKLIKWFEKMEEYEKCGELLKLKDLIINGEEGQVSSNE